MGLARALTGLGAVTLRDGDDEETYTLLAEGLAILMELGDRYQFCAGLEVMAELTMAVGQPVQAVQLFGAVDTLMKAIGGAIPAFFHANFQHSLATLQAQLTETIFAAAWAKGQTTQPEQLLSEQQQVLAQQASASPTSAGSYPANLTEREVEVLRLLAQGLTNAQIAKQLVVSPFTVNAHLRTIYGKLDVTSRAGATRYAIEHKLI
jgi:DNA-binding NarL/FixJ family response regulator